MSGGWARPRTKIESVLGASDRGAEGMLITVLIATKTGDERSLDAHPQSHSEPTDEYNVVDSKKRKPQVWGSLGLASLIARRGISG